MAKPRSQLVVWARQDVALPNTGRINKVKPIDDLLDKGYDKGQKPAAEEFNYILNMCTDWVRYMHDEKFPEFEREIEEKLEAFKGEMEREMDKVRDEMDQLEASVNNKLASFESYLVPVGAVISWPSTTIPKGWLECNGQGFNIGQNPKLYAVLGRGNVPDYRGLFLRGWAHGSAVNDPDANRALGSVQNDAIRNITGNFIIDDQAIWPGGNRTGLPNIGGAFYYDPSSHGKIGYDAGSDDRKWRALMAHFDASRVVPTAAENRPKNVAVMYIIKADSATASGGSVPTGIEVSPSTSEGLIGNSFKASAQVLPVNMAPQYPITWTSQNPSVATVDGQGNVTVVGQGTTSIIASISTGLSSRITVTGHKPLTGLALANLENIEVGESIRLTVARTPSDSTEPLIFSTGNTGIANVNQDGDVVGIAEGSTTISARGRYSGVSARVNITVVPAVVVTTVEDIMLGIEQQAPNAAPKGCVITYVDGGDNMEYVRYKPIQKKVNGVWVTIEG
ncbi:putative tail fiber protein [Salmonella phage SSBI34]|nr:putative tail fiber protein [Salmonella phage SSBI34]